MGAVIIPVIVIAICDMITIMTTQWDPSDAWDAALSCDGCKAIIKGSAEALAGNEREHDGIRVN